MRYQSTTIEDFLITNLGLSSKEDLVNYIIPITQDEPKYSTDNFKGKVNYLNTQPFIRWDALCILINENLPSKISKIESKILLSAKVLGCNVGAVEFFLINDEPVFLEFNPMWGGNASKLGFGPKKFRNHLKKNRSSLESRIPNIYQFTDYQLYYKSLYKGIHDYYQNNSTS